MWILFEPTLFYLHHWKNVNTQCELPETEMKLQTTYVIGIKNSQKDGRLYILRNQGIL